MDIKFVNILFRPFILVHCIIPAFDYGNAIAARSTPFVKVDQNPVLRVDIYLIILIKYQNHLS